jgi:hypothetical protein
MKRIHAIVGPRSVSIRVATVSQKCWQLNGIVDPQMQSPYAGNMGIPSRGLNESEGDTVWRPSSGVNISRTNMYCASEPLCRLADRHDCFSCWLGIMRIVKPCFQPVKVTSLSDLRRLKVGEPVLRVPFAEAFPAFH